MNLPWLTAAQSSKLVVSSAWVAHGSNPVTLRTRERGLEARPRSHPVARGDARFGVDAQRAIGLQWIGDRFPAGRSRSTPRAAVAWVSSPLRGRPGSRLQPQSPPDTSTRAAPSSAASVARCMRSALSQGLLRSNRAPTRDQLNRQKHDRHHEQEVQHPAQRVGRCQPKAHSTNKTTTKVYNMFASFRLG